jgi:hypothetical protein
MAVPPADYANEVARGTHAVDEARAVYCRVTEEPFAVKIAREGLSWAFSRVSLRLLKRGHPNDLYLRFAAHLEGVADGTRRSLRTVSTSTAWGNIAEDPTLQPDAAGEL